jgi:hypothetical protein
MAVVDGYPTMWMTGTSSALEPAIALMAESSPTPRVVTIADIPLMRAYPSAAYPIIID